MFFKGTLPGMFAAADNEVELVSNFNALAVAVESFLQLSKRAAAIASTNKHLLKREFRVVLCVIDVFKLFIVKNSHSSRFLNLANGRLT